MESKVLVVKMPAAEFTFHREPQSLKDRGERLRHGPFYRRVDDAGKIWSTPPRTTKQDDL